MLRMIDVNMNIDCEGKEGHDLGLDREVEIGVVIEDEIEVEIEEEVKADSQIEDTDIKFSFLLYY